MIQVSINGKTIRSEGSSVVVRNDEVYIDGKRMNISAKNVLRIKVTGTLASLETDLSVSCQNVGGDVVAGGSVSCDSVDGSIKSGGSVSCDKVGGNITAGGSVSC